MLRLLAHTGFAGLMIVAAAAAQVTSDPPTTAVVSPLSGNASDGNAQPAPIKPVQPGQPPEPSIVADPMALIPDLPPVPATRATLVGGTIEKLDRVRDEITLSVFGGGRQKILFDPRTRIYNSGKETTASDLKNGERIYVDTILDGSTVFARSIRLKTTDAIAEGQGTVVKYRMDRGELTVRDAMSPRDIRVRTTSATRLVQGDRALPLSELQPGSLIAITFSPEGNGREVAREISILAMPGVNYTFTGQVVHLDLRLGLLVINSSTDHKTYEVYLSPSSAPDENLQVGSQVTVVTNLQDSRYIARNVTINSK